MRGTGMRPNREQKRNERFWSQAFFKAARKKVLKPLASKSATLGATMTRTPVDALPVSRSLVD